MATHNGARFLQEQLDSLAAQNHQDWSLLISDDDSTDVTCDIIAAFSASVPQKVHLIEGPRKGPAANFLFLLNHSALGCYPTALSDQDDIWLPDKLSRFVTVLEQHDDREGPLLFCGATQVVDKMARPLGLSAARPRPPSFFNALVECIAGGNTMGLNQDALRHVQKLGAKIDIPFHDWWLYLLITGIGGQVIYDPVPLLLYRWHDDNLRGSRIGFKPRVKRLREFIYGDYRQWVWQNLAALKDSEVEMIPEARAVLHVRRSPGVSDWLREKMYLSRIFRQDPIETLIIRVGLWCGFVI